MKHAILCTCGQSISVSEGNAGGMVPCPCGLQVEVPTLRELRKLQGGNNQQIQPERVIQALLVSKNLPEELACLFCRQNTDLVVRCRVKCGVTENYQVKSHGPLFWFNAYFLGLFLALLFRKQEASPDHWGQDRTFLLPLRMCIACESQAKAELPPHQAMSLVPSYASLLENYPALEITWYNG